MRTNLHPRAACSAGKSSGKLRVLEAACFDLQAQILHELVEDGWPSRVEQVSGQEGQGVEGRSVDGNRPFLFFGGGALSVVFGLGGATADCLRTRAGMISASPLQVDCRYPFETKLFVRRSRAWGMVMEGSPKPGWTKLILIDWGE